MRNAFLKASKPASSSRPRALSLDDLAQMRDQIATSALQKEQQRREQLRLEQERVRSANAFAEAVADVTPLPDRQRVAPDKLSRRPRPQATPRQRELDEQRALAQSLSDEMDIERLLDTDAALSFRQTGVGPDVARKLRKGHWVVQAQLDLHGLRVDEARERVVVFLQNCVKRELRCVRVVHGKGLGSVNREPVLKGKVQRWLAQRDEVMAWVQAGPADGGSGALLVLLKGN